MIDLTPLPLSFPRRSSRPYPRSRRQGFFGGLFTFSAGLALATAAVRADPLPLAQAHAHNDYEHTRPLLDALDQGFCNVEADVWLIDGELRVAHDQSDAKPGRTLQKLYLDPLRQRVLRNGGRVFPREPLFSLLIDVKSEATNTYRALRVVLQQYSSILTRFSAGQTWTNAVTVVISGNRAREWMAGELTRWAAYDGRLTDLDTNLSPHFVPWISDNWTLSFHWKAGPAEGALPAAERDKLRQLVARTHAQGKKLRLWGAPDTRAGWQELTDAGVDLINTDDLAGLAAFLNQRAGK